MSELGLNGSLGVAPLTLEALTSTVRHEGESLVVGLIGNADLRAKKEIADMLVALHGAARRLLVREVVIDVRELEFMNSSCFKAFVSWLTDIMELPTDAQYSVRFRSNPSTLWQRRSLHALRSYALMIVKIE